MKRLIVAFVFAALLVGTVSCKKDHMAEGEAFLTENKKKEGVKELSSGLQYKVLVAGTSHRRPTLEDRVKIHYEGRMLDGKVFDSNYKVEDPDAMTVSGLISGMIQALKMMTIGSEWEIYIPYNLAYGSAGKGDIPGYALLIFKVELLDIIPAE